MYTGDMKRFSFAIIVFFFVCAAMTTWFAVAKDPEARVLNSADGVLTVTGLVRSTENFSLEKVGSTYRLVSPVARHDAPLVLSFAKTSLLGTRDVTTVYWWNARLGMWESIHDVVANTPDILAVRVTTLGDFFLGVPSHIVAPTMLSMIDGVRAKAPKGTRGYSIVVSETVPDGVPIRDENLGERGGCGGNIGAGDHTEYSSSSTVLSVPVNDVQTPVTFTFVGTWIVAGDGVSCPDDAPLKAQKE